MTARLRALNATDQARLGADPAHLDQLTNTPTLTIERSWHALHFLLCNHPWDGPEPLNHALLGGAVLLDDLGPRLLSPALVTRVAQALFPIDIPAIIAAFKAAELEQHDIYPGNWNHPADWPTQLTHDLTALRQFYLERAAAGEAVLIQIGL